MEEERGYIHGRARLYFCNENSGQLRFNLQPRAAHALRLDQNLLSWIAKVLLSWITKKIQSWINVPKLKSFTKILLSWIAKVLLPRIAKNSNMLCYPG
jgi:uncharacterized membrane protein